MPGIYRPRNSSRAVLYRVLFHNFDPFLTVYESRFEKEYGHFRPVVREVVEEWMDYLELIARVTSHIPDKGQVDDLPALRGEDESRGLPDRA